MLVIVPVTYFGLEARLGTGFWIVLEELVDLLRVLPRRIVRFAVEYWGRSNLRRHCDSLACCSPLRSRRSICYDLNLLVASDRCRLRVQGRCGKQKRKNDERFHVVPASVARCIAVDEYGDNRLRQRSERKSLAVFRS